MMCLSFKLKPKDEGRIFVTDKYFTNGHWLVDRLLIQKHKDIAKAFKPLANWAPGRYENGVLDPLGKLPDIERIIPDLGEGYYDNAKLNGKVSMRPPPITGPVLTPAISAIVWETIPTVGRVVQEAGIAPEYMGLTALGQVKIRGPQFPVVVAGVDDSVIAIVMPVRLEK